MRKRTAPARDFTSKPCLEGLEDRFAPAALDGPGLGDGLTIFPRNSSIPSIAESLSRDPDAAFVDKTYNAVLFHGVDGAGLAHWRSLLAAGATREQVVQGILSSDEHLGILAQTVYRSFLFRDAAAAESVAIARFLKGGGSYDALKANTIGSDEYYQRRGHGTLGGFLRAAYQDILGRDLDATGARHLAPRLLNGESRQTIVGEVLQSVEARQYQVQAKYDRFLGRQADDAGLRHFTTLLQSTGKQDSVTAAILASPEAIGATPTQANTNFVTAVYQSLLARAPQVAELQYWVTLLNLDEVTLPNFVLQLEATTEYLTDVVQNAFQTLLHRAADPNGLVTFVNFLHIGGTIEAVQAQLIGSTEYYVNRGGNTVDGFLTALYMDLLNRAPDASALATFGAELSKGQATTTQVAGVVLTSKEYYSDLVNSYFESYLGRMADPNSLSFFVSGLLSGATNQDIISGIVGSTEFYNNAQSQ